MISYHQGLIYQKIGIMNTILEQLKQYFNNSPRAIIEQEWEEFDSYNTGPTIDDFLSFTSNWSFKWKGTSENKNKKTPDLYSEFSYICTQYSPIIFGSVS